MTADSALDLAKALGTSPDLWMNLQMMWDLLLAVQHPPRLRRQRHQPRRHAMGPSLPWVCGRVPAGLESDVGMSALTRPQPSARDAPPLQLGHQRPEPRLQAGPQLPLPRVVVVGHPQGPHLAELVRMLCSDLR